MAKLPSWVLRTARERKAYSIKRIKALQFLVDDVYFKDIGMSKVLKPFLKSDKQCLKDKHYL